MSWNLNQPITSELAAAKANKDGTDFTNPATWRLGLDVVSTNETRRQSSMNLAAVTFDGATASTRITSTLTGQNIGTDDFSMWVRVRMPTTVFSKREGICALSQSSVNSDQHLSAILYYDTVSGLGDGLVFRMTGASNSDTRNARIANFQSLYSGQVVDIVVTRIGATFKFYINGTDTAYSETTTGTPPAWSGSITSTYLHNGVFATTNIFTGRIYRSVVFNRALSASDVTELITVGVNPADQWGTQTDIINATTLNGGFETAGGGGADVFADWSEATAGTSTINRDTSIFYAGTASCRFDLDAVGSAVSLLSATFARNKRYRVSCFARSTATSGRLAVNVGSTSFSPVGAVLDNASWQERVLEFVTESGGGSSFTIARFAGSSNGSIWLDNVTFTRIGAIVDLDFTVGAGYQATDRSTNALHGTLFNGVEFTQPKRVAVVYGTTSTATSQLMLGSFSIPTNAIIEDIIVNSSGTATVSIGPVTGGSTTIVNAASVVAGRQKLTIATPFSTSGNLYVTSSTTAVLQFTILYTIAA